MCRPTEISYGIDQPIPPGLNFPGRPYETGRTGCDLAGERARRTAVAAGPCRSTGQRIGPEERILGDERLPSLGAWPRESAPCGFPGIWSEHGTACLGQNLHGPERSQYSGERGRFALASIAGFEFPATGTAAMMEEVAEKTGGKSVLRSQRSGRRDRGRNSRRPHHIHFAFSHGGRRT